MLWVFARLIPTVRFQSSRARFWPIWLLWGCTRIHSFITQKNTHTHKMPWYAAIQSVTRKESRNFSQQMRMLHMDHWLCSGGLAESRKVPVLAITSRTCESKAQTKPGLCQQPVQSLSIFPPSCISRLHVRRLTLKQWNFMPSCSDFKFLTNRHLAVQHLFLPWLRKN